VKPVTAAGAEEALSVLRRSALRGSPYRLVVADVQMPGMDGIDLVREIKANPALTGVSVLMLAAGEHAGELVRVQELGIAGYLTKPVRRAELRAAIARVMADQAGGKKFGEPIAERETKHNSIFQAGKGLRILLAEDNAVNQRVARAILEKAGHQVVIAENGRLALRYLGEQSFDLILMDVQMPEMDGFEATGVIRENERRTGAHIPVVAMTAHAMTGDRERCIDAGMDDFVTKPIQPSALFEVIAKFSGASANDSPHLTAAEVLIG
jgi:two-component system, sensor histidine kinase and response regulator